MEEIFGHRWRCDEMSASTPGSMSRARAPNHPAINVPNSSDLHIFMHQRYGVLTANLPSNSARLPAPAATLTACGDVSSPRYEASRGGGNKRRNLAARPRRVNPQAKATSQLTSMDMAT